MKQTKTYLNLSLWHPLEHPDVKRTSVCWVASLASLTIRNLFCEKRRVRRICNRDAVTYVTCYICNMLHSQLILNVMNENLPLSLTISFFRAPDGKSISLINCFLQKYVLLKKGEWVGSVKRILGSAIETLLHM